MGRKALKQQQQQQHPEFVYPMPQTPKMNHRNYEHIAPQLQQHQVSAGYDPYVQQQHQQPPLPMPQVANHFTPSFSSTDGGNPSSSVGKTLDRRQLEHNLGRLIAERGVDVLGQLTREMSPYQIHQLLQLTRAKLDDAGGSNGISRSRKPIDLGAIDDRRLENLLTELTAQQSQQQMDAPGSAHNEYQQQVNIF